jgi:hypothetical protein
VSETTPKGLTSDAGSAPLPSAGSEPMAVGSKRGFDSTMRILLGILLLLVVVGIALVIAFFGFVRHWLAVHTGTLNGGPDIYYNFWSGFGSDLGEATLITAVAIGVYTGVRKVNCHTKGCWRIGHHQLDGTPYILCRQHHPHVPSKGASHAHILDHYRRIQEGKAPPGESAPASRS